MMYLYAYVHACMYIYIHRKIYICCVLNKIYGDIKKKHAAAYRMFNL